MVRFNFLNELIFLVNSIPTGRIICRLTTCRIISKGCLYHIVRIQDLNSEFPPIELVPVVNKFLKVFPDALPGIPP